MMEYPCPLHIRKLFLLTEALIHRSAWNRNSANFAFTEFYEVRRRQKILTRWSQLLLCMLRKGTTPKGRGFEARPNYGRLSDGQSQ